MAFKVHYTEPNTPILPLADIQFNFIVFKTQCRSHLTQEVFPDTGTRTQLPVLAGMIQEKVRVQNVRTRLFGLGDVT